jgi:hypothetical protein
MLSSAAYPALPYSSIFSHKLYDLGEKLFEYKNLYFNFLYNFCLKIPLSKKNLERYCHKSRKVFM